MHIKKDKFQYLSHNTRIILTPVITSLAQTVVNGARNITVMGLIPRDCMYLYRASNLKSIYFVKNVIVDNILMK